MTKAELRELAKRFRDKVARTGGIGDGMESLRGKTAYMWVSRFIDFVEKLKDE